MKNPTVVAGQTVEKPKEQEPVIAKTVPSSVNGQNEIIEMDRMRKNYCRTYERIR